MAGPRTAAAAACCLLLLALLPAAHAACTTGEPGARVDACLTASAQCQQRPVVSTPAGDVRLVGGQDSLSGHLEICNAGTWGQVCRSGWSRGASRTACRQLGFWDGRADRQTCTCTTAYQDSAAPWLNTASCSGEEDALAQCALGTWNQAHTCKADGDVYLNCALETQSGARTQAVKVQVDMNITIGIACSSLDVDKRTAMSDGLSNTIKSLDTMAFDTSVRAVCIDTAQSAALTAIILEFNTKAANASLALGALRNVPTDKPAPTALCENIPGNFCSGSSGITAFSLGKVVTVNRDGQRMDPARREQMPPPLPADDGPQGPSASGTVPSYSIIIAVLISVFGTAAITWFVAKCYWGRRAAASVVEVVRPAQP